MTVNQTTPPRPLTMSEARQLPISEPAMLANRLERMLNRQAGVQDIEAFKNLSIEEMGRHPVSFGQTHVGKTFAQMFDEEKSWVKMMLRKFANSQKNEHLKLFHYVALRVARLELESGAEFEDDGNSWAHVETPVPRATNKAKAKPKARTYASSEIPVPEDFVEDPDSLIPWTEDQENIQALQDRMLNIENALSEVIQHLRR